MVDKGGEEETTKNAEQADVKNPKIISSMEKTCNTQTDDGCVNQKRELLRKIGERESELASGTKLSLDGVSETQDADSVQWLTDEVLRLDEMDFDDDANIDSDTFDTDVE